MSTHTHRTHSRWLLALIPSLLLACGDDNEASKPGATDPTCAAKDHATAAVKDGACEYTCEAGYLNKGTAAEPSCEACAAKDNATAAVKDGACAYTCNAGFENKGNAAEPDCQCPAKAHATATVKDGACEYACEADYHNIATAAAPDCRAQVDLASVKTCQLFSETPGKPTVLAYATNGTGCAAARLAPTTGTPKLTNDLTDGEDFAGYDVATLALTDTACSLSTLFTTSGDAPKAASGRIFNDGADTKLDAKLTKDKTYAFAATLPSTGYCADKFMHGSIYDGVSTCVAQSKMYAHNKDLVMWFFENEPSFGDAKAIPVIDESAIPKIHYALILKKSDSTSVSDFITLISDLISNNQTDALKNLITNARGHVNILPPPNIGSQQVRVQVQLSDSKLHAWSKTGDVSNAPCPN